MAAGWCLVWSCWCVCRLFQTSGNAEEGRLMSTNGGRVDRTRASVLIRIVTAPVAMIIRLVIRDALPGGFR